MEKIIFTGNLGHAASLRDVEKADHSGTTPVVNFSIAVRRGWGEREETMWYDCSWWGERAAKAAQWLVKGKQVLVEGEPSVRTWEKRTGGTAAGIVVRVSTLEFLGGAKSEGAEQRQAERGTAPTGSDVGKKAAENDQDVPF